MAAPVVARPGDNPEPAAQAVQVELAEPVVRAVRVELVE
jgi:hypothetical protein